MSNADKPLFRSRSFLHMDSTLNSAGTPYDSRTLDTDGLPFCGPGESFFYVRISLDGALVEGVVCSTTREEAYRLLLDAEARHRGQGYFELGPRTWAIWSLRVARGKAQALLPLVSHRVSLWKAPESFELMAEGGEGVALLAAPCQA